MGRIPEAVVGRALDAFYRRQAETMEVRMADTLEAAFTALASDPAVIERGAQQDHNRGCKHPVPWSALDGFHRGVHLRDAASILRACLGLEEEKSGNG